MTNSINYNKIMFVAMDKEGQIYSSWSKMKNSDRLFLAEFAKSLAIQDTID